MRQATLQLKTRIQHIDIMNNNIEVRKIILNAMLSMFAVLAIWYVIILITMVVNIVERRTLEKKSLSLSSEVSNLELSYLSVSDSVDLPLSLSMGFVEAHANFATRKSLGSLKLTNNEI
jgi:hypothetical protein